MILHRFNLRVLPPQAGHDNQREWNRFKKEKKKSQIFLPVSFSLSFIVLLSQHAPSIHSEWAVFSLQTRRGSHKEEGFLSIKKLPWATEQPVALTLERTKGIRVSDSLKEEVGTRRRKERGRGGEKTRTLFPVFGLHFKSRASISCYFLSLSFALVFSIGFTSSLCP